MEPRQEMEQAEAERERLVAALDGVRARQAAILSRYLDSRRSQWIEVARDLGFAIEGVRARGVVLARARARPLFLVVTEGGWEIVERHAHGIHAVVERRSVDKLLDAFGREAIDVIEAGAANGVSEVEPKPLAAPARTRRCSACDAEPNVENYARHLRAVHGLGPDARAPKPPPRTSHEVCRLCSARLPTGRLDAHLTAAHGIFHVHAHAKDDREEARRAALHERRKKAALSAGRSPAAERKTPNELSPSASAAVLGTGRDFRADARAERALVARADSPLRNRERNGRFLDAPDVERMDGEADA